MYFDLVWAGQVEIGPFRQQVLAGPFTGMCTGSMQSGYN